MYTNLWGPSRCVCGYSVGLHCFGRLALRPIRHFIKKSMNDKRNKVPCSWNKMVSSVGMLHYFCRTKRMNFETREGPPQEKTSAQQTTVDQDFYSRSGRQDKFVLTSLCSDDNKMRRTMKIYSMLCLKPKSFINWAVMFIFVQEISILFVCSQTPSTFRSQANDTVTFHLLPHSHCDAGYKKTWAEYYTTEVKYVLNSITEYLTSHPYTRFIWSEMIYLDRWFQDDSVSQETKDAFKKLVQEKKIEIVNAGFVMHDEAITTHDHWIGQTTLGHDLLREIFLDAPPVLVSGYQIDPFGSSSFTPTFLSNAGYSISIGNRIPQVIKDDMKRNKSLEFWWYPLQEEDYENNTNCTTVHSSFESKCLTTTDKILMHIYDDHYETPCCGFDWEDHKSSREETPFITPDNIQQRADAFIQLIIPRINYYATPHILLPFGQDFRFQNASLQFGNMDQIISFVNQNTNRYLAMFQKQIILKYATISEYYTQVKPLLFSVDRPVNGLYGSPFLPHISRDHQPIGSWSGYYSQYPNFKQLVRVSELLLRLADISTPLFIKKTPASLQNAALFVRQLHEQARRTVMMMQHHDALPGTGIHHIMYDYYAEVQQAIDDLTSVISAYTMNKAVVDKDDVLKEIMRRRRFIAGGGSFISGTVSVAGNLGSDPSNVIRVEMGRSSFVYLTNASPHIVKQQIIHLYVSRSDILVRDFLGNIIASQILRLPKNGMVELFRLSFIMIHIVGYGIETIMLDTCFNTTSTDDFPPRTKGCAVLSQPVSFEELYSVEGLGGDNPNSTRLMFNHNSGNVAQVKWKSKFYALSQSLWMFNSTLSNVYIWGDSMLPKQILSHGPNHTKAITGPIYTEIMVPFRGGHSILYHVTHYTEAHLMAVQVDICTGRLAPNTTLLSRFKSSIVSQRKGFLFTEENSYQRSIHFIDPYSSVSETVQPMTSWAWIEGGPETFALHTVDPRGVRLFGDDELGISIHRRNGDPDRNSKAGDDGTRVRSTVWICFDQPRNYETYQWDVVAFVIPSLQLVTKQSFIFLGDQLDVINGSMSVSYLTKHEGDARVVVRGKGFLPLDHLFPDTEGPIVTLKSLTFYGENNNPSCSLIFKSGRQYLMMSSFSICALETKYEPQDKASICFSFANINCKYAMTTNMFIMFSLLLATTFSLFYVVKRNGYVSFHQEEP